MLDIKGRNFQDHVTKSTQLKEQNEVTKIMNRGFEKLIFLKNILMAERNRWKNSKSQNSSFECLGNSLAHLNFKAAYKTLPWTIIILLKVCLLISVLY